MIQKIKNALNASDDIEKIRSEIALARKELEKGMKSIATFEENMKERAEKEEKRDKELHDEKKQSIKEVKELCNDFQKEINEFKTMRSKLNTQIVNQVCIDIKKEMDVYIMNIRQKIESLNNAAQDIERISTNSGKVMESVDKLRQISSEIKKEDFELTKYASELHKNDKEKLNLMRKIDVLEKLVAKQRRNMR